MPEPTEAEKKARDNIAKEKVLNEEVLGNARKTSRGIAFGALAEALSLSMLSTSSHHYAAQTMGASAMAATCAKILES